MLPHEWGFQTITSSPNYPQSNGRVERVIQTLKHVFKKADCKNKDPYSSLLEFCNTPVSGLPHSPTLISTSKRLCRKLSCARKLFEPCAVDVLDF